MKMNYVHHVGLICSDLDRSIYFYHDILGFQFQNEPTGWFEGPELEKFNKKMKCAITKQKKRKHHKTNKNDNSDSS